MGARRRGWSGKLTEAGPAIALVCAAYGWTLDQVARMTPAQFEYAHRRLPDVEFRRAYPLAAIEATVKNAVGGKPDPNDTSSKNLGPDRAYSPPELLPWYARPDWLEESHTNIPADAAKDFLRHSKRLPSWVLQLAPLGEITKAAG